MDAETLRTLANRYHQDRDLIRNEEQTKQSLVIPFFRALGYDPTNPREVRLEYTAPFTEHDGKRHPDRMDLAMFDESGDHPLFVVETKPLGADVRVRSPQLARYMSQMHELRFGIMTDGCHYLFFGDLRRPNVMDETPFFQFSLDDEKLDFPGVAAFLTKFGRGQFSTEKMISEAENSRYRQEMIRRLALALQDPSSDEGFVRWLSEDIYEGVRTRQVMERLCGIARGTVRPAIIRVLGDDFLDDLREQIREASSREDRGSVEDPCEAEASEVNPSDELEEPTDSRGPRLVTTAAELEFAEAVRDLCEAEGVSDDQIHHKDTTHYLNVSFRTPTRWFVRFFGSKRRPAITTLVPTDEARSLAEGFDVEDSPSVFGVSRIYLDGPDSVTRLRTLILRSLSICREGRVAA